MIINGPFYLGTKGMLIVLRLTVQHFMKFHGLRRSVSQFYTATLLQSGLCKAFFDWWTNSAEDIKLLEKCNKGQLLWRNHAGGGKIERTQQKYCIYSSGLILHSSARQMGL